MNDKMLQLFGGRQPKMVIREFLTHHMVTIFFVVLCTIGLRLSGLSTAFYLNDIVNRIARNAFMVLALIIPVMAGMGLNFAVVLGAMAGQAAIIMATHWGITGITGILLCVVLSFPLALVLGYFTAKLLNKARGKEMITSLILGFFANGVYQLVFIILVGSVIPMKNEALVLSSGVGLRSTIDLTGGLKYGIDDLWRLPFNQVMVAAGIVIALVFVGLVLRQLKQKVHPAKLLRQWLWLAFGLFLVISGVLITVGDSPIKFVRVPMVTMMVIAALCVFTTFLVKTKTGQDMRTVGQDRHIAEVSGINADGKRVLAILISTVLAAWGQIIFLQNMGAFSTYGSHENAGMFAAAALLIGGATVAKATIGQAILGTILFHTLFIVSPLAGRNLFGDAQLGEFFRAFVAYGVIALSLGLHAWKKLLKARQALQEADQAEAVSSAEG